jgi:glycosyltransferase involved in cell wall biosynthesis
VHVAILGSRGYPSTYGGFETFVRHLAPWLVERGHEVTVYGRGNRSHAETVVDGVRVVDTRGLKTKSASTVSHGITAALHCVRHRPDVVLMLNVANGPAIPILRARRIPVVVNVDGIEWKRAKWGWFARNGFRMGALMVARLADARVADSREIARIWREDFGVESEFIPYGADLLDDTGSDLVTELGLAPARYALAVARLAPENNVELFVDALEELGWSVPGVVVGSANYDNPLEDRLRKLEADGRLLWLGHVPDQRLLHQLWANAGVYFHGHSVGGTNPSLLSALGCGAPTVAVATPFNAEVLGPGGLMVGPQREAVAEALRRVVGDSGTREWLTTTGQRAVSVRYNWNAVLTAYELVLRRLIASGAGTG